MRFKHKKPGPRVRTWLIQEAFNRWGLLGLSGHRLIHQTGQSRLAAGSIVLVNDALFRGLIQPLDGDGKPFLGDLDIARFHGFAHALRAFANAAFGLTIALAALETLTMSFQCRFVRSQPDPPVFLAKKYPPRYTRPGEIFQ